MRLGLTGEHKAFFAKHKFLEIEGLLSPKECFDLKNALKLSLASTVKGQKVRPAEAGLDRRFRSGRDLSRKAPYLRKLVCRPNFAGVISELTHTRQVRLGFDQAFVSIGLDQELSQFWKKPISLEEMSSIQGVVGGLLINIGEGEGEPLPVEEEEGALQNIFTEVGGSGVFFSKDFPLDFSRFAQSEQKTYILIAYTEKRAMYRKVDTDPNVHELKGLGYAFGDQLRENTHPTLFR